MQQSIHCLDSVDMLSNLVFLSGYPTLDSLSPITRSHNTQKRKKAQTHIHTCVRYAALQSIPCRLNKPSKQNRKSPRYNRQRSQHTQQTRLLRRMRRRRQYRTTRSRFGALSRSTCSGRRYSRLGWDAISGFRHDDLGCDVCWFAVG